jgi:ABC-type phosphate/phosphonate transport system substrate-binding protein
MNSRISILFLAAAVLPAISLADNTTVASLTSSGAAPAARDRQALVFSAPPRESERAGKEKYGPVAAYLSRVLHRKVVYKYPGTWGVYRTEMLRGDYDIVFDGPHFISYRIDRLHHNALVTIPVKHEFAVIVRAGEKRFHRLDDLAGHTFCTHAPPNLGTLTLLSHFPNPARQPAIVNTKGWGNIYAGVISGRCEAGVIPIANLKKFDKTGKATHMVFHSRIMPNQAFSAGPRVSPREQHAIAAALVSDEADAPTAELRATYRVGDHFELANNKEFAGMDKYLRDQWGYY